MYIDISQTWPASVMWGLAVMASYGYAFVFARRHKRSIGEISLLLGASWLGALIGGKWGWWVILSISHPVDTLSWVDLMAFWAPGYSSMGAMAGATIVGAAIYRLNIMPSRNIWAGLDIVVSAGLIALAIARWGCILDGCGFGKRTTSPLKIYYSYGSPAWQSHYAQGDIDIWSQWSLGVHSIALYESIGIIGIIVIGHKIAGKWNWRPGILSIVLMGLYLGIRSLLELLRDASDPTVLSGGMNIHHIVLGTGLICLIGVWGQWRADRDREVI